MQARDPKRDRPTGPIGRPAFGVGPIARVSRPAPPADERQPYPDRRASGGSSASRPSAPDLLVLDEGAFGNVVATLAGVQGASIMKAALDGAFASTVLQPSTKALMFAVVGRTLGCRHSEEGARRLLASQGVDDAEIDAILATLDSKRPVAHESRLLSWVRDTVHYQTATIQHQTRLLAADIGDAAALEAIGVAALANATVRLAMLLE